MVTVIHLVLYKTADLEYITRERAIHLLQILDRRSVTVWRAGGLLLLPPDPHLSPSLPF